MVASRSGYLIEEVLVGQAFDDRDRNAFLCKREGKAQANRACANYDNRLMCAHRKSLGRLLRDNVLDRSGPSGVRQVENDAVGVAILGLVEGIRRGWTSGQIFT